jgi:hypothetical protein
VLVVLQEEMLVVLAGEMLGVLTQEVKQITEEV